MRHLRIFDGRRMVDHRTSEQLKSEAAAFGNVVICAVILVMAMAAIILWGS